MRRNWQNFPFDPSKIPFFYGWIILVATTLGTLCSLPGQTMGVGVFTDYLLEALGLTRTQLAMAYMFGTILSGSILPFAGDLTDRWGVRSMVVFSSVGLAISLVFLSFSPALTTPFGNPVVWSLVVATVAFLGLRFFGQGCLTMVSRVTVGRWFNHYRGRAMAIAGVFVSFGFSSSPLFLNNMVQAWTWQATCWILAAIIGLGMAFLGWLIYREKPEDVGLTMDGLSKEQADHRAATGIPDTKHEFTRREAIRTLAFWVFTLGVSSQGLVVTAITFHIASIGEEMGLTRDQSYAAFLMLPYFSVTSNIVGGWLSDRIKMKYLLIFMMAMQAIGTIGLRELDSWIGYALFSMGYGLSGGLFGIMVTVSLPRFFGRQHLGSISGFNMSIMVYASALGPVLFSALHQVTGSYQFVALLCVFLPLILLLAATRAENPQDLLPEPEKSE